MYKDQGERTDRFIDILLTDKNSPLKKFKDKKISNDVDYIEMWLMFIKLSTTTNLDWLEKSLYSLHSGKTALEFNYFFVSRIRDEAVKIIESKKNLSFKPRLEKYVEEFPEEERIEVKKLVLSYLYTFYSDDTSFKSIFKISKVMDVPFDFIAGLTSDHRLFTDKILEFAKNDIFSGNNFLSQTLLFKEVVYKIFSGVELDFYELNLMVGSSMLELFNLLPDDQELLEDFNLLDIEEKVEDIINDTEVDSYENILKELNGDNSLNEVEEISDTEGKKEEIGPFRSDIEYLYDKFKWFKAIRSLRKDKNDEFTFDPDPDNNKIKEKEKYCNRLFLNIKRRLSVSIEKGFTPKIEFLSKKLHLSTFEKNILTALVVNKVFIDKAEMGYKSDPTVSELIYMFIDDPKEQVKAKKYFLKNSRLVRSGLIEINEKNSFKNNIFELDVQIDDNLIENLLGEKYDIADYIDGSFLYHPKISIETVVLKEEVKKNVLSYIDNFPNFLKAKKNLNFSDVIEYGNSLVMLFVGPSGTGKTMLANAIANHSGSKILLFNLNNIAKDMVNMDTNTVLRMLFQEARMNNAILFFDESENLLKNRFNDLLIQIERHEGIVIFATNASFTIDEAMKRRINLIMQFKEPGAKLRKHIWELHLPRNIKLHKNVNIDELASRFELSGGLIKNAVFGAISRAVNDSGSSEPVLKMGHLQAGAKEQLANKFILSNLNEESIPRKGIDSVILPKYAMEEVWKIINYDKAKKILFSEYGFGDSFLRSSGMVALFHGASGTGKSFAAEAIAFETGKKLKIVNYSQIVSMWVGEAEKNLEALFKEVSAEDTLLLFDEADALFTNRTSVNSSTDRHSNSVTDVLLSLLERKNVFAILTTNCFDNIDTSFLRRMNFIVEFKTPDATLRKRIWKVLLPEKLPLSESVDIGVLSKDFKLTGGDIKNVIINASVKSALSLEKNRKVTMEDFVEACKAISSSKEVNNRKIGFQIKAG